MARVFGGPVDIEQYRRGIEAVKKEQISAVAQKAELDTVYFLRGELEGEGDCE